MTLFLVGLGLDPTLADLTRRAAACLHAVDEIWLDTVSADAVERRQAQLQQEFLAPVSVLGPLDMEQRQALYQRSRIKDLAIAVAGDPLVQTPYAFWLREAAEAQCLVQIIPGLSAISAVASSAGLDASRCVVQAVQDPTRLDDPERQAISRALRRGPCIVLVSGKHSSASDVELAALGLQFDVDTKLVRLGDAGSSALLIPRR